MVLKRLFICGTGEDAALCIHCSGLLGDRALRWQILLIVHLKRPLIGDIGKDDLAMGVCW